MLCTPRYLDTPLTQVATGQRQSLTLTLTLPSTPHHRFPSPGFPYFTALLITHRRKSLNAWVKHKQGGLAASNPEGAQGASAGRPKRRPSKPTAHSEDPRERLGRQEAGADPQNSAPLHLNNLWCFFRLILERTLHNKCTALTSHTKLLPDVYPVKSMPQSHSF